MTVGDLIADYRERRFARIKRSTQLVNEQAFGSMVMIFGADTSTWTSPRPMQPRQDSWAGGQQTLAE